MNKTLPHVDRLKEAMANVDVDAIDEIAADIGREAVQVAMAVQVRQVEVQQDGSAEAQRQRDLDAALADAIEVVARARARNGRRVCSRHDGEMTRKVFEALRSVMGVDGGADNDPSFQ